jgi:hypothetical protein
VRGLPSSAHDLLRDVASDYTYAGCTQWCASAPVFGTDADADELVKRRLVIKHTCKGGDYHLDITPLGRIALRCLTPTP